MDTAPALPTRFPCWCRATYSWGGESKNDLGFVEGDLIECLNAGDGSWWMGRLRRDKRAMGLFPSNFVKVLEENFIPVSRTSSATPATNANPSTPEPSPKKTKTFRKPFQAYVEMGASQVSPKPLTISQDLGIPASQSNSPSRQTSRDSRPRGRCPPKSTAQDLQRQFSFQQNSTAPSRQSSNLNYSPGKFSSRTKIHASRERASATPVPYQDDDTNFDEAEFVGDGPESSPPPPPPPHRTNYNASSHDQAFTAGAVDANLASSRGPSPRPHTPTPLSPMTSGHTPSPFREAIDDIMCSLDDMAIRREDEAQLQEARHEPLDPWSPEAFEELNPRHNDRSRKRPRSSLGIASSQREHVSEHDYDDFNEPQDVYESQESAEFPPTTDHHNQQLRTTGSFTADELFLPGQNMGPPPPPPKSTAPQSQPSSSLSRKSSFISRTFSQRKVKNRKSAYELGHGGLDRAPTTRSIITNSSSGRQSLATNSTGTTDRTSQSIMSGRSAGGFSATSAGSLARRTWGSMKGSRPSSVIDAYQQPPFGFEDAKFASKTYHNSSAPQNASRPASRSANEPIGNADDSGGLGGLTTPRKRKSGFFKKLVESAKTGAASARGTIGAGNIEQQRSPIKQLFPNGVSSMSGGSPTRDRGQNGPKHEIDWMQVRRDINRSNSLSQNEKNDRIQRCQIMDFPVIAPEEALLEDAEGDESQDGLPVLEPIDFQTVNLQLVDKSARFVNSLPPMANATSLAQSYLCRPYRSDVQRLRAIFTWVSEKVAWEEDFEGEVDARRVIQMRRGCSQEVAVLVFEMCSAVGIHSEVIRGLLKAPGDIPNENGHFRPNHWWNAVLVDGCWRILDCSLASPTNPKRCHYSSASSQVAEAGFFLARPTQVCYTHVPMLYEQQHICPPIANDTLLALPCACPSYFRHGLRMLDYDTSLFRIENLELVHVHFTVTSDVECIAEVEARSYSRDIDGDTFESGETTITRALTQADWVGGQKRYTVKAHLPGDEGHGILKVYAGKRGLMHSVKDNPHPLAFTLPIVHQGNNPPYEFLLRHPTPHAMRHDLYVAQPQCRQLAMNNTFVFAIRQHPSFLAHNTSNSHQNGNRPVSPMPFTRPGSAMSMVSSVMGSDTSYSLSQQSSSTSSAPSTDALTGNQKEKPAKLAIQSPSGKILRMMRKSDCSVSIAEAGDGGVWETIIKVGERGTWRGLVLADRSARWCVFGEWECV